MQKPPTSGHRRMATLGLSIRTVFVVWPSTTRQSRHEWRFLETSIWGLNSHPPLHSLFCVVLRQATTSRFRPIGSDLGHAAVDNQFDARDITTFVGSEKRHRFGNLVQGSGATEGYFGDDAVCVLLDLLVRCPIAR